MDKKSKGFNTKIIHTGYLKKDVHRALQMPIYNSAAFEFDSAEQIEQAFLGQIAEHSYTRSSNPSVEHFEQKVKSVTEALHVTAASSGMGALTSAIFTIAYSGSNIVTSKSLFGNTYSFFQSTIKDFGVEVRFCDLNNNAEVEKAIDQDTCAVFFETITNPQLEIVDISNLSRIAKEKQVPLISDTTLTPFNIFKAKDYGIDIEIVSSTKIISGGFVGVGGLIIDYGTYDWSKSPKIGTLAQKSGASTFNVKLRREIFKNIGACMSPFTAYFHSVGLETLKLRYDKAAKSCLTISNELSKLPKVKLVNHPTLAHSKYHEISKLQFGEFPCSLLTFDLGSKEEAYRFMDKLSIIKRATNLYDNKSLILHPASTIYCDFSAEVLANIGIRETMMRLSIGIEDVEDLIEDLHFALGQ
jgi:O-acetylhomoserine (thiol)-lyase